MIDNNKAELDRELTQILRHLPGWSLDPRYNDHCWCAAIVNGTGHGIHFNIQQAKGRYSISGTWPRDNDHNQYTPSKCKHITVSRSRPPEKIVAELNRRFLPWYVSAYAEQVERMTRQKTRRSQQQQVTVELADLLGREATLGRQSYQVEAPGITVEVEGGGESVSIQIRYKSVKIAKAVLRAYVKAGGLDES